MTTYSGQLATWFAMGKYAAYVWPSFALTLVVVLLNIRWAQQSAREARTAARRRIVARGNST